MAFVCGWLCLQPAPVHAESGRPVGWYLGEGHVEASYAHATMQYEAHLEGSAEALLKRVPAWWAELEAELGVDVPDQVEIQYVDHAGRVADATGMPRWVAGVAHGPSGRIAIARHGPDGARTDLEGLLRHELAHIILYRAVGGQPVPRWFNEGVAESLGEGIDFLSAETLASAVFGRGVPPLHRIERGFWGDRKTVSISYAASRDFVRHLRFRGPDTRDFHYLIGQIRRGHNFEAAFRHAYGLGLFELEREWQSGLGARFVWYVLLGSASAPFFLAIPLVAIAWLRRRRQLAAAWARIDAEERGYWAAHGF